MRFHQCAHLQRGDPAGGICMWYAEAWIRSRSGNLRGGNRKSEVERRVAPPMPACVALLLELMDIGTSVVGVLHLPHFQRRQEKAHKVSQLGAFPSLKLSSMCSMIFWISLFG
ncbi:hypothetical protein PVAP13_3KG391800 [Panicum virgatum]|uniref:Uncharacterized protein n=1 Tax=Panicum virgatum TaxID=38727 RepID=A0A8T0UZL1_PANVG|nr:hypothetical protein PVAP13_3KG391800 [Panicum virgatum]